MSELLKEIYDVEGKVRITAPDGTVHEFPNAYAALFWFNDNYRGNHSLVLLNSKILSLPEVKVTAPYTKQPDDPIRNKIFEGEYGTTKFTPTEENIRHYLNIYEADKKVGEGYGNKQWGKVAGTMAVGGAGAALLAAAGTSAAPWLVKASPYIKSYVVAPTLAGGIVDLTQRLFTGTTTTELLSNYLLKKHDWSPFWADMVGSTTNPGYWINFLGTGKYTAPLFNKLGIAPIKPISGFLTPALERGYYKAMRKRRLAKSKIGNTPVRTDLQINVPMVEEGTYAPYSSLRDPDTSFDWDSFISLEQPLLTPRSTISESVHIPHNRPTPARTPIDVTRIQELASAKRPLELTPPVALVVDPFLESEGGKYLLGKLWTYEGDGVFKDPDINWTISFNTPYYYYIPGEGPPKKLDPTNRKEIKLIISGYRILTDYDFKRLPDYVFKYSKSKPFNEETIKPLLLRHGLVTGHDLTSMSHASDTGRPILNSEGHLVGYKTVDGIPYSKIMQEEFDNALHGSSIGFNSPGDTSTSSTPMLWLLLSRYLDQGKIAKVYVPSDRPTYVLNDLGRAFRLNHRGKIVAVPGTERLDFNIPHLDLRGRKVFNNITDAETPVVKLESGEYLTKSGDLVPDVWSADPLYYHNGALYDANNHTVIFSLDSPFLTRELYVEYLNKKYIEPLAKKAGIKIPPAKVIGSKIEVPSIAGIKYNRGGTLLKKNRKELNNND